MNNWDGMLKQRDLIEQMRSLFVKMTYLNLYNTGVTLKSGNGSAQLIGIQERTVEDSIMTQNGVCQEIDIDICTRKWWSRFARLTGLDTTLSICPAILS